MNKKDLQDLLKSNSNINKEYVVVLNTHTNITRRTMLKLIHNLSNRVNRQFCKYFKKIPNRRIKFYCFPQTVLNNTHCHILLDIPDSYNPVEVKEQIQKTFIKLEKSTIQITRFILKMQFVVNQMQFTHQDNMMQMIIMRIYNLI